MIFMLEKQQLSDIKGILKQLLNETRKQTKLIEAWMGQDKHYHDKTLKKMN